MKDDRLTLAAIGVLAMCLTTVDHEVIGHGAACLLNGGRILHISTTLFACSQPSPWVAFGGPANDLAMGVLAWLIGAVLPARHVGWRLFLGTTFAFSLFWESGYLVKAMLTGDGDLYYFARAFLGQPETVWRIMSGGAGAALYLLTIRLAEARFTSVLQNAGRGRMATRTVWVAASFAAVLAALVFKGDFWPNLRDSALEIGLAACPLLLIPRKDGADEPGRPLNRNWAVIAFAACIFVAFTATIGHGLGSFS